MSYAIATGTDSNNVFADLSFLTVDHLVHYLAQEATDDELKEITKKGSFAVSYTGLVSRGKLIPPCMIRGIESFTSLMKLCAEAKRPEGNKAVERLRKAILNTNGVNGKDE